MSQIDSLRFWARSRDGLRVFGSKMPEHVRSRLSTQFTQTVVSTSQVKETGTLIGQVADGEVGFRLPGLWFEWHAPNERDAS